MRLTHRGRVVLYPLAVLVALVTGWNAPYGLPLAVLLVVGGLALIARAFRLEPQPRHAGSQRGRRDP